MGKVMMNNAGSNVSGAVLRGSGRAAAVMAAALLAVASAGAIAGCNSGGQGTTVDEAGPGSGLAKLTEAAGGSVVLGTPEATAEATAEGGAPPAAGVAGGGDAPVEGKPTLDALLQKLGTANVPIPGLETPTVDSMSAYRAQQAEANATAGIADVTSLLGQMPRLATFTPPPKRPALPGTLIYLRNGTFYRVSGSGGDAKPLVLSDTSMPPVWSPPDDPGRAWQSPDGAHVAAFAGSDAAMWIVETGSGANRRVSDDNLPNEEHTAVVAGKSQTMRLRPGKEYTLVYLPEASEPLSVLIDDNSRHVRGQGRLRVVHAASEQRDRQLVAYIADVPFGAPMAYGRASGALGVTVGNIQLVIKDDKGNTVATLAPFALGDHELKTIFLTSAGGQMQGVPVAYDPTGEAPGLSANVRVFNAGAQALGVDVDGGAVKLATGLPAGNLGPYTRVPATLSTSQRQDVEIQFYGLNAGEHPVAWAPDSRSVAFLGAGDGKLELYVSDLDGPAVRVTDDALRDFNPVWSPDSRHLTWLSEDEVALVYSAWLWRAGDAKPRLIDLAPIRQALGLQPTVKVFLPVDPIWLDDSRFAIFPSVENQSKGVWVVDAGDGGITPLYRDPVKAPRWSAAAKALVFNTDEDTGEIVVLTADGQARTVVATNGLFPQWSPDGRLIAYTEGPRVSSDGWRLRVIGADGSGDRVLTDKWPLMQVSPPVPGPLAKLYWFKDGKRLLLSRVGRDYGAAERAGIGARMEAGPDIENVYAVPLDGSAKPTPITDLTQVFYLDDFSEAPEGGTLAFVGLWYSSRAQQIWTVSPNGGKPGQIDGPVRWFAWLR